MRAGRRRDITRLVLLFGVVTGMAWGLTALVPTRQGVNFTVSTSRLPLYAKALGFMDRHCQYRELARTITHELRSDQAKALAIAEWTRTHIRPTPPGFPVIDDHILHIIIRGYGEADQMADVFTTLATYAGIPAFWRVVRLEDGTGHRGKLIVSFVRVDGRWTMCDVTHHLIFLDAEGGWADVDQLLRHPEWVQATAGTLEPDGMPYAQYVERLQPFRVPTVLRAQKQMPLPRMVFEVRRLLHLEAEADAEE